MRSLIRNNLQSRIPDVDHTALRADRSTIAVYPVRALWLDPFAESNITGIVGRLGRRWIAVELRTKCLAASRFWFDF